MSPLSFFHCPVIMVAVAQVGVFWGAFFSPADYLLLTSFSVEYPGSSLLGHHDYWFWVTGLSQDCPRTIPGLSQDCLQTVPGLSQDCLRTVPRLPQDYAKTTPGLP
ncbi:hypothetical protein K435DRAFT_807353 [Dendrothele bispora CBS 962.96]|uniref:Uncharacterized protein n=1 Tax=Dendrothele bispora (strain CBS 962.96) TaxID=1314807 RepID=A0A4S8L500_DENBC|nr:hypothetical protein K435DRAFT_807353 [Dendrothele bispora CBS 962.96]